MAASAAARLPLAEWEETRLRLAWCYAGTVPAGGRQGLSQTSAFSAWLLLTGNVVLRWKGKAFAAGPGEWLVFPAGLTERRFSDGARLLSVHFSALRAGRPVLGDGLPLVFPGARHPALRRGGLALATHVARTFAPHDVFLTRAPADAAAWLELQGRFSLWAAGLLRALAAEGAAPAPPEPGDERVRRALARIDHLPLDRPFPKREVAGDTGLSGSQLDRLFRARIGRTPRACFERRRQEEARRLLAPGELRVKEAAARLGFRSASHFSTWFRRATGVWPGDFAAAPPV